VKIKYVTAAIILALAFVMVALPPDANGQTRRRTRKSKPATKTVTSAAPTDPFDSEEQVEFKRQVAELAKMPSEQLVKLGATIDLLQRVTRKVQIGGIPEYFLSEDPVGESGLLESAVNDCIKFLPEGIMRKALRGSLQALVDAWIIDLAEKTGNVSDQVLKIIDRYKLEGNILIVMRNDVLNVAEVMNRFASGMLKLALK
jgi:hypothetical protein